MIDFHHLLVTIVAFIVLIGVMVVVHEFGHFVVAKLCGVRVEAFSFGFGPRLFGYKYGDTDYKVCLLPLGGFVKMTGEAAEQNLETPGADTAELADDPGNLLAHPRWQRMLIGFAGPFANFVLAFVLMVFYFHFINEVPSVEVKTTTIEWVIPGSAAAQAGLETGDVVLHFDTADKPDWEMIGERLALNANQVVPITVERGGETLNFSLRVPAAAKSDDFDFSDAGILPEYVSSPIAVHEVIPGTPAEQAGIRAGDAIQSVDGHAFHFVLTLQAYMKAGQGKPMSVVLLRNGVTLPPVVATPAKADSVWRLGFVAAAIPVRYEPLPLNKAVAKSTAFCSDKSFLIVDVLGRLFTRKVSVNQLQGPVGIARMAGDAAETKDWVSKFGLAAAISLNLGIINLLPFPILDGGMILFLLIESVLRHDININVKERIYQAAFVVIVAFFAFVIFNDVTRLPIFAHLKP
jgi:regulator of sigma E protease